VFFFANGGSVTNAKVYQRYHDAKKVEEHCHKQPTEVVTPIE